VARNKRKLFYFIPVFADKSKQILAFLHACGQTGICVRPFFPFIHPHLRKANRSPDAQTKEN
jgi:hypothetical protein